MSAFTAEAGFATSIPLEPVQGYRDPGAADSAEGVLKAGRGLMSVAGGAVAGAKGGVYPRAGVSGTGVGVGLEVGVAAAAVTVPVA